MYDAMLAESVTITSRDGDDIEAYLARPMAPGPFGGVVVIHHMPGYDEGSKEIVRRYASQGYNAICPNLFYREAPGAPPDDAAARVRSLGGVPDERLVADVSGAVSYLRGLPSANGRVGVAGYCSGGRQAFLSGLALDIDAAIDCYGAYVTGVPPEGHAIKVGPLVHRAGELRCPLLGLFGNDDAYPSPAHVDELEAALRSHGKTYEFHRYDGAGHAFFAAERPRYNVPAAVDGWQRKLDFFARYLGSSAAP
jgi:carboxymethylenebutenolidase